VQIRTEIIKLHQRLQATRIYVTHDQIEAMTMGDRIVVMNDGVVQQHEAPLVLYNLPVNLFVAGFFGSPPINFISGTLKEDGDKIRFREIGGGTIEVAFAAADRPAAREFIGKNVILGIRPEDLEVAKFSRKEGKVAATGFPAIVDIVEPMGAETNLYLQTGAHTLVCRSQAALDHREAGRRFQFEMNLEKAHLFDPVSTNRLA
jgi:multiple sugar transport system ATP-binding protein